MADTFQLRLISPRKEIFSGQAEAVMLPGESGDFGVLSGHTKFVTALRPGELRLVARGKTQIFAVGGGFAEVHGQGVTVLADSLENQADIDVERAQRSIEKAKAGIKSADLSEKYKIARFNARLTRALNRITIAQGDA